MPRVKLKTSLPLFISRNYFRAARFVLQVRATAVQEAVCMDAALSQVRSGTRRAARMAALLFAAIVMCSCSEESREVRRLHAASIPVQPLAHDDPDVVTGFPEKFPEQVAVYLLKSGESALDITHPLLEMGIPFFATRDIDQAVRHHLILVFQSADSQSMTDEQAQKLNRHVVGGGGLLAVNAFLGSLKPILGFQDFIPSRKRYRVNFAAGSDPMLRYLNRPEELEAPLGDPKYGDIFWTNGYVADASAAVLARFQDGTAALLRKQTGSGTAYLLGVSFQDVILRNQVNRDYDAERHYVNQFEPGADIWMLLLRAWYESQQPGAVRLATIPAGQSSVLLLSHDVDWENSFDPGLDFARMEKVHRASSTFFVQTKYITDANGKAFFFGKAVEDARQFLQLGSSIGSHSVIHSRGFNHFALGNGSETFASYRARGTGFDTAEDGSVFGEVRVSKELLEGQLPGQHIVFFRAGHLRVPPTLPEALQRCGYEFDSSFTAGDVLTNFPYALPLDLGFTEDSGLYEFPVTFEDEESPVLVRRIPQSLEVMRANAENGAISVFLIHSNEARMKLTAEEAVLRQLPPNITAMDMLTFARFWRARDRLRWSIAPRAIGGVILSVKASEAVDQLTFEFQRAIESVEGGASLLPDHHRIVLPALAAGEGHIFTIHYRR